MGYNTNKLMIYKVRDFRKCVKEALDTVERGDSVYIERLGRFFKVVIAEGKIAGDYKEQV